MKAPLGRSEQDWSETFARLHYAQVVRREAAAYRAVGKVEAHHARVQLRLLAEGRAWAERQEVQRKERFNAAARFVPQWGVPNRSARIVAAIRIQARKERINRRWVERLEKRRLRREQAPKPTA